MVSDFDAVAILIDLSMPGLDGLETCAELEKRRPELLGRCTIVTADPVRSKADEASQRFGVRLRTRPFRQQDFLSLVNEAQSR